MTTTIDKIKSEAREIGHRYQQSANVKNKVWNSLVAKQNQIARELNEITKQYRNCEIDLETAKAQQKTLVAKFKELKNSRENEACKAAQEAHNEVIEDNNEQIRELIPRIQEELHEVAFLFGKENAIKVNHEINDLLKPKTIKAQKALKIKYYN